MTHSKILVWFRRDLRAYDHAALYHALTAGTQVHCVFVYDTGILDPLPRNDRRVQFIHASLAQLDADLHSMGGHLLVRIGDGAEEVVKLADELQVDAVYTNRDYDPAAIRRDALVAERLETTGRVLHSFKDQVIFEKDEVLTLNAKPFSVFTPYKNAWLKRMAAHPDCTVAYAVDAHAKHFVAGPSALPSLQTLGFDEPDVPTQPFGMDGASALFEAFIPRMPGYDTDRNFPALNSTSRLSMHLRFGTVSVRHLVRTVQQLAANGAGGVGAPVWLAELIWREFYQMILYVHPHVVGAPFKPVFEAVQWEQGPEADVLFAAWCEGRTGYPLVDAAMAQINQTGFMHNRLRMVVASFLVKDLGIDWRWGEQYFAVHLNDYELASNNGGWQWAASTGCDAQPWFRIFNPVTQSEKFDAQGEFIKQYLPQLAQLDRKEIHAPWLVPAEVLSKKGVRLGDNYPQRLVEHDKARQKTLERFAVVKAAVALD
ncbi:MAG: DNA photolyase family protein [Pseudomonadota bacterium]|nr:DNA photolyase family protein [Pseudomonadota bacterium]